MLISLGHKTGADFLANLPGYAEKPELVGKAIRLMEAINALDWQACAAVTDFPNKQLRLWLNELSRDRLFAAGAPDLDEYPETLRFEEPLCSNLYPLLFTKNGERRPVCRLPWQKGSESFGLPVLRQEASPFARLMMEKLYPQNPRLIEQNYGKTQLELEELLIDQFKQKAEQMTVVGYTGLL